MQTTQTILKGQSLQTTKMHHLTPSIHPTRHDFPVIGGKTCTSAAQAMTVIGYGDSFNLAVRSLDYQIKCEDFKDFAACIELINSYNEFDSSRILNAAKATLNIMHFLNENNPNNGGSLFSFTIARESSPALYVHWNEKYNGKVIERMEAAEATEITPAGTMLFWEEYTAETFTEQMKGLSERIGADEFSISTDYTYQDGKSTYTARFWFD